MRVVALRVGPHKGASWGCTWIGWFAFEKPAPGRRAPSKSGGNPGSRSPRQTDSGVSSGFPEQSVSGRCTQGRWESNKTTAARNGERGRAGAHVLRGLCSFVKYWNEGEPNSSGEEDCAEFRGKGWNDSKCSLSKFWICKKPTTSCSSA